MLKFVMLLAVLIASVYAEASYDVSYLTLDGKPTVEITWNGKVCKYILTDKDRENFTQKMAKELVEKCRKN